MTGARRDLWRCDGCMSYVARPQIADMVDGEHVVCCKCMTDHAMPRTPWGEVWELGDDPFPFEFIPRASAEDQP